MQFNDSFISSSTPLYRLPVVQWNDNLKKKQTKKKQFDCDIPQPEHNDEIQPKMISYEIITHILKLKPTNMLSMNSCVVMF